MALKTFLFVITNCLCIYFCNCGVLKNDPSVSFAEFVLDGKSNCELPNVDRNVIKLFKTVSCPSEVRIFSSDYFVQRLVLPCFGAYDALYNLCEFPSDKINVTTIPESFKDPKTFCTEAKTLYEHIPFKYKNEKVKEWGDALQLAMKTETHCNNLCVLDNIINEQCTAMVTFAQEYIHLKGIKTKGLNAEPPVAVDMQITAKTTESKSNSKPALNSSASDKTESTVLKNANESVNPSIDVISQSKINDAIKEPEEVKQNPEGESKPVLESDKPPNQSPIVDTHNTDSNVPETQSHPKAIIPSNIDTIQSTSTVAIISNVPNGVPNLVDEGMNEENDKTATDVDDFHGEIEEAEKGEAKEKGNPDEENEKPIEEEKNTAADTEQHAAYHANGMSSSFNPMGDSFSESEDSYSFTYIITTMAALCCVYLLFHYRNKLLALALEGRKGRSSRGRGRPSSANYSKLHSNLEEAIASNVTTPSATHVLY